MSALRSRTMPLIASSLLFFSFLFATIHLGEGLKCYACSNFRNNHDLTCEAGLKENMLFECPPSNSTSPSTSTTTSSSTVPPTSSSTAPPTSSSTAPPTSSSTAPSSSSSTAPEKEELSDSEDKGLQSFSEEKVYAAEAKYGCYYAIANVESSDSSYSLVERGCNVLDEIYIPPIKINGSITYLEYRTCESDGCNSSGGIQIGVISLFLPLIASLLVTR